MNENRKNTNIAYIYVTNMLGRSAAYIIGGVLFLPIIYLILISPANFWFCLLLVIIYTSLTGRQDAKHRFSVLKKNLPEYAEIGSFWVNQRGAILMPKVALKYYLFRFKTDFVLGESYWLYSTLGLYLLLIVGSLYNGLIQIRANLDAIFVILSTYVVMSLHLFFSFLYWKYKIAKKIKDECGLNYKELVSVE